MHQRFDKLQKALTGSIMTVGLFKLKFYVLVSDGQIFVGPRLKVYGIRLSLTHDMTFMSPRGAVVGTSVS